MPSPFTRQLLARRNGQAGQSLLLVVTTLAAVLSLLFAAVRVSHLFGEKVSVADAADAIALSGATWEARGLNLIAAMNDGILRCLAAIRLTCAVWAALALSAPFGGWAAFAAYSKQAPRLIRNYWQCARRFARWADTVRRAVPWLVLAETASLARQYRLQGSVTPFDPAGRHDGQNTLELHVRPGPPITLADAFGPLSRIRAGKHQPKWVRRIIGAALGVVNSATAALLRDAGGPVHLLVPEDDLPRRQYLRFVGGRRAEELPAPMADWIGAVRFGGAAAAHVYGGDATSMTWKSRLFEGGEPQ